MNLENLLKSPEAMPIMLNSLDDISDENPEQSLLNISIIKHEPLDLTDNDSNEESTEGSSQKLADKSINEEEIQENGNPPLDEFLLEPECNSEDILKNNDDASPFVVVNSSQNLNVESKKNSKILSNIHVISDVLVNRDFESVLGDFEDAWVDQNSPGSDPLEDLVEDPLLLEDNTYSCSLCSFTTDRQLRLNDHERNHRKTNLPIFQCFYCSQRYTRNLLHLHIQNVHPGQKFQIRDDKSNETLSESSYECSKCSFSTRLPMYLKLHMKKHLSRTSKITGNSLDSDTTKASQNKTPEKSSELETALSCSLCSFLASEEDALTLHIKTHLETTKGTDLTGKPCWNCGACSYSTCNFSHMKSHVECHLKNKPNKKCPGCDYQSTSRALTSHVKLCFREERRESKRLVQSSNDKITFKTSLKYKNYSVSRTDKLKLKFHKADTLTDSKGSKIYKCKLCSYTQRKFGAMVNHIHSHKNVSVIKCPNCDFKSTPRAVKYHRLKCKEFLKLDSMGTATAKIDQNKDNKVTVKTQHKCSNCSFSTHDELKFKVHMKKHLNEPEPVIDSSGHKVYQCKLCSYTQGKFVAMVGHIATHKYFSIVTCPNCDFKSTPRAVKHHLKRCKKTLKRTDDARNIRVFNKNQDEASEDNKVSPKIPHKCSSCSFITSDEITFNIHVKNHLYEPDITTSAGYKVYQCKMCSYGSRDFIAIAVHINSHKKNLPIIKCPNCDFKSTRRTVACHLRKCKEHVKSVSDENNIDDKIDQNLVSSVNPLLKCNTCSFSTTDDLELKVHKKKHFFEPEVSTDSCGVKIYQCRMCSYALKDFALMVAHINSHKNVLYNVKCPNCDFQSTPWTVKDHSRTCKESLHLTKVIEENTSKADNRRDLVEFPESNKVSSTKHLKCSTCSFSTTDGLKLKLHKKNHIVKPKLLIDSTGQKEYCCNKCSYVCGKFTQMASHINTHKTCLSIVKCSYCDFKSTPRTVKFHLRKCKARLQPSGVKNISEVTKELTKSSEIKKTKLVHNNIHQCRMCSYTTSKLIRMRSHMNAHKRNFPIVKCPQCDYRSTARALNLHMTNIHFITKVSFNCEHCSFVTSKIADHTRHMKSHEPTSILGGSTEKYNQNQKLSIGNSVTSKKISSKVYRCKLCPFITRKSNSFCSHMRVHSPKKQENNTAINSPLVKDDVESHAINQPTKDIIGQRKNKSTKMFKCRLCSFVSSHGGAYSSHMTVHDQKHPIKKCPRCNFKSTPSSLLKHMNTKRHNVGTKCRMCSLVCRNPYNLNNHMRSHSSKMPIEKCTHCSFRSTIHALKAHIQKCQNVANKNSSKLSKDGLFEHPKKNIIDAEEDINCKDNSKTIEIDKISKPRIKKSLFQCSLCSFSTSLRIKLKFHRKKYHLEPSKTEDNNESSQKNSAQSIGVKSKRLYKCNDCVYVTKLSNNYSRHLRTHLYPTKRTFTACKKCGYRSTRCDVKIHSRTCQGTKRPKIKCTACSYYTDRRSSLKLHIENSHFDELKVQHIFETIECTICDYVTLFKQKVNEHTNSQHGTSDVSKSNQPKDDPIMRTFDNTEIHESDKTVHKCTSCAFSSVSKYRLKRHIDMNHVERPTRQNKSKVESRQSDEESSIDRNLKPNNKMLEEQSNLSLKQLKVKSTKQKPSKSNDSDKISKKVSKIQQKNSTEFDQSEAIVPDGDEEDIFIFTPGIYACSLCSYTTFEKAQIYSHRQLHRKNVPIRSCPNDNCSYKSTPKALSLHFLKCSESIEDELSSTSNEPEEEKPLKQCPTTKHLKEPDDTIHPKTEVPRNTGPRSFQCKYCSFTSFLEYVMERHMNSHTLLNLPIEQCNRCDFRSTPSALAAHLNSCTRKSINGVPGRAENEPPKKKVKHSKGAVANGADTKEVEYNENKGKVKIKGGEVAAVHRELPSDDDSESSESHSKGDSESPECQSNDDSESSESQKNLEVMSVPNHNAPEHVINNHMVNRIIANESEIPSISSSSATVNLPKNTFKCPKCPFSSKLRIVLKVHIDKNH